MLKLLCKTIQVQMQYIKTQYRSFSVESVSDICLSHGVRSGTFLHIFTLTLYKREIVQYTESTFLGLLAEIKSDVFFPISSMNRVVIFHHMTQTFNLYANLYET
jgi:hypothetical protein